MGLRRNYRAKFKILGYKLQRGTMITIILNDAPYGTERSYNGLRIALSLSKKNETVHVFLMGDAVSCAVDNQQTPNGYYNIGRMIKSLLQKGGQVNT